MIDIDWLQKLCDAATSDQMVFTEFRKPDGNHIRTVEDIAETMAASASHSQVPALFGVTLNDEDENNAATVVCYTGNGPTSQANAAFFAEARNAMPDLLAELRTLRALRDRVDTAPHGWQFVADDGSLGVVATSHHPPFPDAYYRQIKLVPVEVLP